MDTTHHAAPSQVEGGMESGGSGTADSNTSQSEWVVLVCDREKDIHKRIGFLSRIQLQGRPLSILHADSLQSARRVLLQPEAVAVVIIEHAEDSPFSQLPGMVRKVSGPTPRILLRTEAGSTEPDIEFLARFDISDYLDTQAMTRTRLVTFLTTALSHYQQGRALQEHRRELDVVIEGSREIQQKQEVAQFASDVLNQLASLAGSHLSGVAATGRRTGAGSAFFDDFDLVTTFGEYRTLEKSQHWFTDLPDGAQQQLRLALESPGNMQLDRHLAVMFNLENEWILILLTPGQAPTDIKRRLLALQVAHFNIGFKNLSLIEKLDTLAFQDARLGVPNRNAFSNFLQAILVECPARGVVYFIGIKDLESYSVTLGPSIVDGALKQLYERLNILVQGEGYVAYDGSGNFILYHLDEKFAANVLDSIFVHPISSSGRLDIHFSPIIVRVFPTQVEPTSDAIWRACYATLLHAKQHMLYGVTNYSLLIRNEGERRIRIRDALPGALEKREIKVYLQPKIDMSSNKVVGAEALARWQLDGESIAPSDFIPVAEMSGLTTYVTNNTLIEVASWQEERMGQGLAPLPVAVNLSMLEVNSASVVEELMQTMTALNLTPDKLEFEITESATMYNFVNIRRTLFRLVEAGYHIAIDDFGTGYSSLSYLDRLPVTMVKVDRAFIHTLTIENARKSLVSVICAMAKSLNLELVAEGVETPDQAQILRFLGVDIVQGFYFAKPMRIDQFIGWERGYH